MTAKSLMHSLISDWYPFASCSERANNTSGGISIDPALPRKAGHGSNRVWEAWKPASHASYTASKFLRDFPHCLDDLDHTTRRM